MRMVSKISAGTLALVILGVGLRVAVPAAQSRLEFRDGRVYLSAKNVPIQELLQAWEQRGGTKVLLKGPVPGDPVTFELDGVPETLALDTLLASTIGYAARERAARGDRFGPSQGGEVGRISSYSEESSC